MHMIPNAANVFLLWRISVQSIAIFLLICHIYLAPHFCVFVKISETDLFWL